MPGLEIGAFRTRPGAFMSAEDNFEIVLRGQGGHAARPDQSRETLVAACDLVMRLQTIVSRRLEPTGPAVVSVTELITDGTRNALPGMARVLGDARSFAPEVSGRIETELRRIAESTAAGYGLEAEIGYSREFAPLRNDPQLAAEALAVATALFGADKAKVQAAPAMASEDFARFLDHVPGCFVFLGNGLASRPLHNPGYDFDDRGLIHGARFHAAIVRRRLPLPG
jgi:hippurate hydrolase